MLAGSVVSFISENDLAEMGNDLKFQTFASFTVYIVIVVKYLTMSPAFFENLALMENSHGETGYGTDNPGYLPDL